MNSNIWLSLECMQEGKYLIANCAPITFFHAFLCTIRAFMYLFLFVITSYHTTIINNNKFFYSKTPIGKFILLNYVLELKKFSEYVFKILFKKIKYTCDIHEFLTSSLEFQLMVFLVNPSIFSKIWTRK
jgi:hypothetical protein